MDITLKALSFKKHLNNCTKTVEQPDCIVSPNFFDKENANLLEDKNYNRLQINRNRVAFGGVPEVYYTPLEKKVSTVLGQFRQDDVLVIANNIEEARESLKRSLPKVDFLIKRLFFIEEKDINGAVALYQNNNGNNMILNLSSSTFLTDNRKKHAILKGESGIIREDDFVEAGNAKFKINKLINIDLSEFRDGIKLFDFSSKDTKTVSDLNFKHVDHLLTEEHQEEPVKKIMFSDVGGQDRVISELKKSVLYPIKYRSAFKVKDLNRGIVLHGVAGGGKALLALALANESKAHLIKINGAELEVKWVGETEKQWREVFEEARQNQPCIVFIDEIDAVGKSRENSDVSRYDDKVVNQLLTLMSDLEKSNDSIFVIGATNNQGPLDKALTRSGRFGKFIEMKAPDLKGCLDILKIHTKNKPVSDEFNYDQFAQKLYEQKATGADIAAIVSNANSCAYERSGIYEKMENETFENSDMENLRILPEDFDKSLAEFISQSKARSDKKNTIGFHNPDKLHDANEVK